MHAFITFNWQLTMKNKSTADKCNKNDYITGKILSAWSRGHTHTQTQRTKVYLRAIVAFSLYTGAGGLVCFNPNMSMVYVHECRQADRQTGRESICIWEEDQQWQYKVTVHINGDIPASTEYTRATQALDELDTKTDKLSNSIMEAIKSATPKVPSAPHIFVF